MNKTLTVGQLFDRLQASLELEDLVDGLGHDRALESGEISSPGLVLAGYVERFVPNRLQALGETEISYLASLLAEERTRLLNQFFSFKVPAVFVTKDQELPSGLLDAAKAAGVALFRTKLKTNEFYRRLKPFLESEFAPAQTLHGSLADVFGVGLLVTGKSGIGKSECVLDLVERGHRLVADDIVMVTRRGNDVVIGRAHELQRGHMEIRGIGLINIPSIFGVKAVRQQKRIEVIVQLEEWNQSLLVDRTGLDTETGEVLGVTLPKIRVPLNPGKNLTVIAEVIALNHLLKYSGVDAASAFNERLIAHMARADDVEKYLQEDDE